MAIKALTTEQRGILEKHGKELQSWLTTKDGIETIKIHRDHEKYFKEKLSKGNLNKISGIRYKN